MFKKKENLIWLPKATTEQVVYIESWLMSVYCSNRKSARVALLIYGIFFAISFSKLLSIGNLQGIAVTGFFTICFFGVLSDYPEKLNFQREDSELIQLNGIYRTSWEMHSWVPLSLPTRHHYLDEQEILLPKEQAKIVALLRNNRVSVVLYWPENPKLPAPLAISMKLT